MYNKAAYATYSESIIDHVLCDTTTVQFAGVSLELVSALSIGGTDDGVEHIIVDASNGDEYGVIRTDMSAAQMAQAVSAANEMYAAYTADLIVSTQDKAAAEYNFWF